MELPVTAEALRVLLIERGGERAGVLERALSSAGHRIVAQARSVRGLHEAVERLQPDVVVIDIESPDAEVFSHIEVLGLRAPRPVVVFTDDPDCSKIREAVRRGVTSYVVEGFAAERIEPIVRVALARFEKDTAVRAERDHAQAKLAERKLIERAKGILMRKRGIGEDEAYHALRRIAMDRNLRMSEVAERLISMSDLFG